MKPKFKVGDSVSSNGFKGLIKAIELNSFITGNVQPYYVVKMEYGKELLPESSLKLSGFINFLKSKFPRLNLDFL